MSYIFCNLTYRIGKVKSINLLTLQKMKYISRLKEMLAYGNSCKDGLSVFPQAWL